MGYNTRGIGHDIGNTVQETVRTVQGNVRIRVKRKGESGTRNEEKGKGKKQTTSIGTGQYVGGPRGITYMVHHTTVKKGAKSKVMNKMQVSMWSE